MDGTRMCMDRHDATHDLHMEFGKAFPFPCLYTHMKHGFMSNITRGPPHGRR